MKEVVRSTPCHPHLARVRTSFPALLCHFWLNLMKSTHYAEIFCATPARKPLLIKDCHLSTPVPSPCHPVPGPESSDCPLLMLLRLRVLIRLVRF